MRKDIEELIEDVRIQTENLDVSDTIGIQDNEIISHLNVGQRQIQSKIVGKGSKEFSSPVELVEDPSTTSGRVFLMPVNSFMRSKITALWTGDNVLRKQVYAHNITLESGCCSSKTCCDYLCYQFKPFGYAIVGNRVYLTGGSLNCDEKPKALIVKTVPDLQQPILQVTAPSAVPSQGGLLDVTSNSSFVASEIKRSRRYCLVDEDGIQVAINIKVDSFDSTTNQLILSSSNSEFIINSTQNLTLVRGENSSTHSSLEPLAVDYVVKYAIAKVLQRDGSTEYNVHSADLVSTMQEAVDAYTNISDDVMTIPYFPEEY